MRVHKPNYRLLSQNLRALSAITNISVSNSIGYFLLEHKTMNTQNNPISDKNVICQILTSTIWKILSV